MGKAPGSLSESDVEIKYDFNRSQRPRQMQCITLVLGMVAEDDKLIKAAAVRALGIYILYPSLREVIVCYNQYYC